MRYQEKEEREYDYIVDKRTAVDVDDGLDLAVARAWLDMDKNVSYIEPCMKKSL